MSLSAASSILLLHAFVFVLTTLLLLAAMVVSTTASSVPVTERRDLNMTTLTNASVISTPPHGEMYYCFLCTGRHPLLIHMCPIYWDECHLNCWDAIPDAPSPPAPVPVPVPPPPSSSVQGKECYVMKLYMSGRYVIVQRLSCDVVGIFSCFLTCGGGELDDQKVAMGTTAVPATIQGSFVPFELCNTQAVNALRAPPSSAGVVVPAGAAH